MFERRQGLANLLEPIEVQLGDSKAHPIAIALGQNLTPRVNDLRMTVRIAPAIVVTDLGRGENKTLRFNGAGA